MKLPVLTSENSGLMNYFKKDETILIVAIFGSYLDNTFVAKSSDIDIAILFKENVNIFREARIMADISEILDFEEIDLLNLNKANFMLRYNAVIGGEIIYERERESKEDYIESVLHAYRMHYYRYNSMQEEFMEKLAGEKA